MKRTILFITQDNVLADDCARLMTNDHWVVDKSMHSPSYTLMTLEKYKIIVVDADIGETTALDICKNIHLVAPNIGLIVISSRKDEINVLLCLELGADNYIHKPLSPRTLMTFINVLYRRMFKDTRTSDIRKINDRLIIFGDLSINPSTREVHLKNTIMDFSSTEFDLLYLLASNAGNIVSRQAVMEALRGIEYNGIDRSIDLRISRIRRKLGDNPTTPQKIKTIRGKGYLFNRHAW